MEKIYLARTATTHPETIFERILWFVLTIINIILVFRFVMKLLDANGGAAFTKFVNTISYPFIKPFLYVFPTQNIQGVTFEWVSLVAILVYGIIAWLIVYIITLATHRPVTTHVIEKVEDYRD